MKIAKSALREAINKAVRKLIREADMPEPTPEEEANWRPVEPQIEDEQPVSMNGLKEEEMNALVYLDSDLLNDPYLIDVEKKQFRKKELKEILKDMLKGNGDPLVKKRLNLYQDLKRAAEIVLRMP